VRDKKIYAIVLVLTLAACRGGTASSTGVSSALIVPPGAFEVQSGTEYDGTIKYNAASQQAGDQVLTHIRVQLQALGWKPEPQDSLGLRSENSHSTGWDRFLEREVMVNRWIGEWRDPVGDLVWYQIEYRTQPDETKVDRTVGPVTVKGLSGELHRTCLPLYRRQVNVRLLKAKDPKDFVREGGAYPFNPLENRGGLL
jgi:hypothetical protein